jgi:hypothetical protein
VAVGPDGFAVVRNPYDVGDMGERFIVVMIAGVLLSAGANSLWPGHLDAIGLGLGIVLLAALLPVVAYGLIALAQLVTGTVSAVARPRRTLRELKRIAAGPHTHGVTDYLAVHDPRAIRLVVEAGDVAEIVPVRGWLRPTLEIGLRSGQVHRVAAHPWWRLALTRLARDLRELTTSR